MKHLYLIIISAVLAGMMPAFVLAHSESEVAGFAMNAQNFGNMMRGVHPAGFITLWYIVGILGAIALVLVIVKYLKELFK